MTAVPDIDMLGDTASSPALDMLSLVKNEDKVKAAPEAKIVPLGILDSQPSSPVPAVKRFGGPRRLPGIVNKDTVATVDIGEISLSRFSNIGSQVASDTGKITSPNHRIVPLRKHRRNAFMKATPLIDSLTTILSPVSASNANDSPDPTLPIKPEAFGLGIMNAFPPKLSEARGNAIDPSRFLDLVDADVNEATTDRSDLPLPLRLRHRSVSRSRSRSHLDLSASPPLALAKAAIHGLGIDRAATAGFNASQRMLSPRFVAVPSPRAVNSPYATSPFVSSPLINSWVANATSSSTPKASPATPVAPAPMTVYLSSYENRPDLHYQSNGNALSPSTSPCTTTLAAPTAAVSSKIMATPYFDALSTFESPAFASSPTFAATPLLAAEASGMAQAFSANQATSSYNGIFTSSTVWHATLALFAVALLLVVSAAGALACMVRRRRQIVAMVISPPVTSASDGDVPPNDQQEEKGHVSPMPLDPPVLPDPVLPTKMWRNASASDSQSEKSDFRHSVEAGIGTLGYRATLKQSKGSTTSSRYTAPVAQLQRFSSMPNIGRHHLPVEEAPTAPDSSFSSSDHQYLSSSTSSTAATSDSIHRDAMKSSSEPAKLPAYAVAVDASPIADAATECPVSPTLSVRSKMSAKSTKSVKQALWSLRKAAFAVSSGSDASPVAPTKKSIRNLPISYPIERPDVSLALPASETGGYEPNLNDSVSKVFLGGGAGAVLLPVNDGVTEQTSREPVKATTIPVISPTRSRRATIVKRTRSTTHETVDSAGRKSLSGAANHRQSVYGGILVDSTSVAQALVAIQDVPTPSPPATTKELESTDTVRASVATIESVSTDGDIATVAPCERRNTLYASVCEQQEKDAIVPSAAQTLSPFDSVGVGIRADKTRNLSTLPVPSIPLPTPPASAANPTQSRVRIRTSTLAQRTRSMPGPKPVLDAALTRFSRLDLASEFSLDTFDTGSGPAGKGVVESHGAPHAGLTLNAEYQHQPYYAASPANHNNGQIPRARRARSSTVGDQPAGTMMPSKLSVFETAVTAHRVPLPVYSKATRVSVANAVANSEFAASQRSFAHDLNASITVTSCTDDSAGSSASSTRSSIPLSDRTSIGSAQTSSIIDFSDITNQLASLMQLRPNFAVPNGDPKQRLSTGSLQPSRHHDVEEDDLSIYSRDSGSHDTAWDIARARVRARTSVPLESVLEESS